MKLLLLCVGLSLVCAHAEGDVVRSNIDLSKISGEWYSILVASEAKEKIEDGGSMKVFIERIEVLDNSSLLFVFHVQENGKCTKLTLVADQTEEDGVYSVGYDGHNVFRIFEMDYGTYILFDLMNFSKNITFRLLELSAREPDVSPKLKEHFVKYCEEQGIAKENIIDLTKGDRCLQARGSEGSQASSAE